MSVPFILTTCQIGAESALKDEIKRLWPEFRFAYSRPGFVTFKLPENFTPTAEFDLGSAFASAFSFSLGKAQGSSFEERCSSLAKISAAKLHVWDREKGVTELTKKITRVVTVSGSARILDVILVSDNEWWLGWHIHSRAHRFWPEEWPGGIIDIELPAQAPSRAYLKMEEGLKWSGLAIAKNDRALELGSAPGGASYALLNRGLSVTGVDPGEMAAIVAKNPKYKHVKAQAMQHAPERLGDFEWLFSDMNITPDEVLKCVAKLKSTPSLRGGLLTFKLKDWKAAEQIPEWIAELKKIGFTDIRVAHLVSNRSEVCVSMLRSK